MIRSVLIVLSLSLSVNIFAAKSKSNAPQSKILTSSSKGNAVRSILINQFKRNLKAKEISDLKKQALNYAGKAIPALVYIMKSSEFPDRNRWVATFLVGQIMGKKSGPFISKFLSHPNWVLRMASLKTLLALKLKNYGDLYGKALKDKSFIVRKQALENIRKFGLEKQAPVVWSMLYDKRNYYNPKDGGKKRTNLIKEAIKTVGELKFEKAKGPLLSMVQKEKYKDIFPEIDYSLTRITGKNSPDSLKLKKRFWRKVAISNQTF